MTTFTVNTKTGPQTFQTAMTFEKAVEFVKILAANGNYFANSLMWQFANRGVASLSTTQIAWIYKLATDEQDRQMDVVLNEVAKVVVAEAKPEPKKVDFSKVFALLSGAGALKMPRITLAITKNNRSFKVQFARKNDRQVVVKINGHFLGYIYADGTGTLGNYHSYSYSQVTDDVAAFAENPVEFAKHNGILTGTCCFCGRGLCDVRSTTMGYGPICAQQFHLPWSMAAVEAIKLEDAAIERDTEWRRESEIDEEEAAA